MLLQYFRPPVRFWELVSSLLINYWAVG